MQDYDENPIIIKNKEFKLEIFYFITFLPLIIYILCDYIDEPTRRMENIIFFSIVITYVGIKNIIKQRKSYIYFTNYQIFQKDDKEVFKEFKIKDIKSVRKNYKNFFRGFKNPDIYNSPAMVWMRTSIVSKIMDILGICFLLWLAWVVIVITLNERDYKTITHIAYLAIFFIAYIVLALHFANLIFRLVDGLNPDILKNNVLIQTKHKYIVLINLTKQEFDRLEEYFRNFNIEIKG